MTRKEHRRQVKAGKARWASLVAAVGEDGASAHMSALGRRAPHPTRLQMILQRKARTEQLQAVRLNPKGVRAAGAPGRRSARGPGSIATLSGASPSPQLLRRKKQR